ncbi:MAG: 1-(5-phosphoribosyl)-5-[Clostridia bacterium]|nr:1-(5-phosphoribosyl)-5-[(5-phosphoribosylamino)methylideneamino]imidazole-4-carboxamide isomerase [Clostridia bacterium]
MFIFPAIDLYEGKAVRLTRGDYNQMTVYDNDPVGVAKRFFAAGATKLHVVDLEGAKDGTTANLDTIRAVLSATPLEAEIGGGIRSLDTVETYISAGAKRVILGTAAIEDPAFLKAAAKEYGAHIAVGVDIKDGYVAVRGWTEVSGRECFEFCRELQSLGIRTVISTDISRDGMQGGTNRELYARLKNELSMNIIASGGISTLDDLSAMRALGVYGAIVGRVLYTGALKLEDALAVAREGGI